MNKLKTLIVSLGLILGFSGALLLPQTAMAAVDPLETTCKADPSLDICKKTDMISIVKTIVNTLMFVIGIVAVVMIIFSGVKYAISMGDSGNITKAKNTLMYSIVGLAVTFLAYAIVNFVIDSLSK